ncbi:MAG: hypothetical protein M3R25_08675 [Bacteroidota bacterium]|nr:hypothetical protein [Bacteroidota bacterium]
MTKLRKQTFFEPKSKPLLSHEQFLIRQLRFVLYAMVLIGISLLIGMFVYHWAGQLDWVKSFHNASMILSGMGEVYPMPDDKARICSGVYALFSGVVFVSTIAVMFAPLGHRILHIMHLEAKDQG